MENSVQSQGLTLGISGAEAAQQPKKRKRRAVGGAKRVRCIPLLGAESA